MRDNQLFYSTHIYTHNKHPTLKTKQHSAIPSMVSKLQEGSIQFKSLPTFYAYILVDLVIRYSNNAEKGSVSQFLDATATYTTDSLPLANASPLSPYCSWVLQTVPGVSEHDYPVHTSLPCT